MTNAERGEVRLRIGGAERTLCLTMGALAELEHIFGAADIADLGAKMRVLRTEDVRLVLRALLRGGGETAAVMHDGVSWPTAARACAACIRAAFA